MAKAEKKSVKKSSKKEAKTAESSKKDPKKLSPLEKARLAKAKGGGKAAKKTAKKKPETPTWKAPADFKPHFLEVTVKTEKDGLLGTGIAATRYQGKYDRNAPDNKKFDMRTYDMDTLVGILARLGGVTYHATGRPNAKGVPSRLTPNTPYRILYRIGKRAKDGTLTVSLKGIWTPQEKKGKVKAVQLEKTDPAYRKIRKANKILPAAFKNVLQPPKKTRSRKKADEE